MGDQLFMPGGNDEFQLVHYFAGECSEEEAAEIEAWINADPACKRRVEQLRRIWDAAEQTIEEGADVDAMWDGLTRRLGPAEFKREALDRPRGRGRSPSYERRLREKRSPQRSRALSRFGLSRWAVAAIIAVCAMGVWGLHGGPLLDRGASGMRMITTDVGQRARITLGDGTRVTLNAESELTLPPEFGDRRRRVRLQGQAYFEVAPDKERPFLVHAGGSITRVLGTKFDVGAYPEDDAVRVVVTEGAVSVRSEREEAESSVRLRERQMAALSKSDQSVVRREVDPAPYLAWTEGQLIFTDAPFEEVARRLKSWYGLQVELAGATGNVDRLNAAFKDEPVGEKLTVIAETLDLQYDREGKRVTFYAQE